MFEQAFLSSPPAYRRPWTMAASVSLQAALLGLALLAPLVSPDRIPSVRLVELLFAPSVPAGPPPSAPPAVIARSVQTRPEALAPQALMEPRAIPAKVTMVVDEAPLSVAQSAGETGVPGGIGMPGAEGRGLIDRLIADAPKTAPAPPVAAIPPPAKREVHRITVGGNVQAARLLNPATPAYPPLARQARVAGVVRLQAVIGRDGRIQEVQLLSGHPLLVKAALETVRQWRYSPTLLNGEPVEVATQIDVHFILNQ